VVIPVLPYWPFLGTIFSPMDQVRQIRYVVALFFFSSFYVAVVRILSHERLPKLSTADGGISLITLAPLIVSSFFPIGFPTLFRSASWSVVHSLLAILSIQVY